MRRDDDLSERHGCGTLLQVGAAPLERRRHFLVGYIDRLGFFPQLGERLLLEVLSPVLLDERLAILVRRSESCLLEFVSILVVRAELGPNLLDLTVGSGGDLGL